MKKGTINKPYPKRSYVPADFRVLGRQGQPLIQAMYRRPSQPAKRAA